MSAFDRDTALEPLAVGRWKAAVPAHWFIGTGPNGGWIAAILTRTMILTVDDDARPPRSLTVHFLEAPVAGPVEVSATVERAGRKGLLGRRKLRRRRIRPPGLAVPPCRAHAQAEGHGPPVLLHPQAQRARDLTIHWRAPLGGDDPHPWTKILMRSTTAAGGVWEEDGELWSRDGVLLAQSRQLAIVRRPQA